VPASFTAYIDNRRAYNYAKHGQSDDAFPGFITPEVVDTSCVLGTPERHIEELRAIEAAGVSRFNIYPDNGDEENIIATYGKQVIPVLAGIRGTTQGTER